MTEERLKEIEERHEETGGWRHGDAAELLAEVRRLREVLQSISARGCYHCSDDARAAIKVVGAVGA